jgi:hypothetical protein
MKTRTIHHVNENFTYKVIETQTLLAGRVVSTKFSEIITL